MNNSLLHISAFKRGSVWAFDDADRGLVAEPFVGKINEFISNLLPENCSKADLLFSAKNFPSAVLRLSFIRFDLGGAWYRTPEGEQGWLCPVLFLFFPTAPAHIYASATPSP